MTSIAGDLTTLAPGARVELFVVDATGIGGPVVRFYNGVNANSQPLVWQGATYEPMPIEAEGFEVRADGPAARPTVRVSNVGGLIGAFARAYRNLQGALLVRKRTRVKYLDALNFPGGVNPTADATAALADDVWRFDRVARRNRALIEWELVSPIDLEGVMLPGRQIRISVCGSAYRSAECGYTGGPVAKADDTPTADPAQDKCSLHISGCKLRFGANAELPIDIFPGAGVLRNA
jgi:lambda family phage minor tail protein L